jgi:carbonic anhydrase
MNKLLQGYRHFHDEVFPEKRPLFEKLAGEQHPRALFITCADSRILPDMITQADPGDLFICRNAGNIVPPYGERHGGVSATIEYAVLALGVRNIIVCGHSDCGAMKAVLHPEKVQDMPTVASWLFHAETARRIVDENYPDLAEAQKMNVLIHENVLAQIDHLKTHPSVASRLSRGQLNLYAWVYEIRTGDIDSYDAETGHFVPLDPAKPVSAILPPRKLLALGA